MQRYFATASLLWLLTSTTRVDANTPPSEPVPTPPTASSGEGSGASEAEAEALFAEAQRHYEAGELDEALRKTLRCYERTHAVNLLHNLAVIYRELGDCTSSLEYFRRYARDTDDDQQRDSARQHIAALSGQCSAPSAAESTPPAVPVATASSPASSAAPRPSAPVANAGSPRFAHWSRVGWVALGTGVLTGASATYFALEALDAQRDTRNARTSTDFDDRSAALTRSSALAGVLGAMSLVAFGLGTYAFIVANETDRESALTLSPSPHGASIDYRLRF